MERAPHGKYTGESRKEAVHLMHLLSTIADRP